MSGGEHGDYLTRALLCVFIEENLLNPNVDTGDCPRQQQDHTARGRRSLKIEEEMEDEEEAGEEQRK